MQKLTSFTATAILILAMAACAPPSAQEPAPKINLPGTAWTATAISGNDIPSNIKVTLNFSDDGRISGTSGCNRYFADYTIEGDRLSMGLIAGTKMMCAPDAMKVENRFLSLLHKAETFSASDTGDLILAIESGDTITAIKSANEQ